MGLPVNLLFCSMWVCIKFPIPTGCSANWLHLYYFRGFTMISYYMNASELLSRARTEAENINHPLQFLNPATIGFTSRFSVNSGFCCCMFDYLPYHKDQVPSQDERIVRNLIFDFKKGIIPVICADLMAAAILEEPMLGFGPDTILLTIPASTIEKHDKRFRRFSAHLAENLGIVDGFSMLKLTGDREIAGRPRKSIGHTMQLDDTENILPGRDILVVDDVYAKGHSFDAISDFLSTAGAKSVTGVFFALSGGE